MANLEESLYQAFAKAETGGVRDPWIRTMAAPAAGSTAYGPVQITRTLAENYVKKHKDLFSQEELAYLEKFIEQGQLFAKFGKEPEKEGYDPRYDYGGSGDLTTPQDKALYESVAKKMLMQHYKNNKGNLSDTIKEWRFGAASKKDRSADERYWNEVESTFMEPSEPAEPAPTQQPTQQPERGYNSIVDGLLQELQNLQKPSQRASQAPSKTDSSTEGELTEEEQRVDAYLDEVLGQGRQETTIQRGERKLQQTYEEVIAEEGELTEEEKKVDAYLNSVFGQPQGERVVLRETTNPAPEEEPQQPEERADDPSKDPIYGLF